MIYTHIEHLQPLGYQNCNKQTLPWWAGQECTLICIDHEKALMFLFKLISFAVFLCIVMTKTDVMLPNVSLYCCVQDWLLVVLCNDFLHCIYGWLVQWWFFCFMTVLQLRNSYLPSFMNLWWISIHLVIIHIYPILHNIDSKQLQNEFDIWSFSGLKIVNYHSLKL